MTVFSVSWGKGKSFMIEWYAAADEAEVIKLLAVRFKHRKASEFTIKTLRGLSYRGDEITGPGPVVLRGVTFVGDAATGPVRSCS